MSSSGPSFWDHIYNLRERGLIPRVWKASHLRAFMEEPVGPSYSRNTINVNPPNSSISIDGEAIGDFVRKGAAPKAWRVGRGQYRLVADPEDDERARQLEMERAVAMADVIRSSRSSRKQAANFFGAATSTLASHYEKGSRPGSLDIQTGMYPYIEVGLITEDRQAMSRLSTAERAVHIVRKHLLERFGPDAEMEVDEKGAGLRVSVSGEQFQIEVSGTESSVMDWEHMKISDQRAHYALTSGGATMYRVVNTSGSNPRIYILNHGEHFTLEPEPGWAVKKVIPEDERYPLRGEPYTYDLPFEPVAEGDWEVLA